MASASSSITNLKPFLEDERDGQKGSSLNNSPCGYELQIKGNSIHFWIEGMWQISSLTWRWSWCWQNSERDLVQHQYLCRLTRLTAKQNQSNMKSKSLKVSSGDVRCKEKRTPSHPNKPNACNEQLQRTSNTMELNSLSLYSCLAQARMVEVLPVPGGP